MTDTLIESDQEEWRAVPDFPDYEVSNHGRVKSLPRKGIRGGILSPSKRNGYPQLTLWNGKKKLKTTVHRLVLTVFRGPPPKPDYHGCHLDGSRDNNRLDNLAWLSRTDNEHHKYKHGTAKLGERHWASRLTADDVLKIRQMLADDPMLRLIDVAKQFGVSEGAISSIRRGQTWKHVTDFRESVERAIATRLSATGCLVMGDPRNLRDAFEQSVRERFGFVPQADSLDGFISDVRRAMLTHASATTPDPIKDHERYLYLELTNCQSEIATQKREIAVALDENAKMYSQLVIAKARVISTESRALQIRRDTIEECAKVCEHAAENWASYLANNPIKPDSSQGAEALRTLANAKRQTAANLATHIRSLPDTPQGWAGG